MRYYGSGMRSFGKFSPAENQTSQCRQNRSHHGMDPTKKPDVFVTPGFGSQSYRFGRGSQLQRMRQLITPERPCIPQCGKNGSLPGIIHHYPSLAQAGPKKSHRRTT
jgi:hypothetical protein